LEKKERPGSLVDPSTSVNGLGVIRGLKGESQPDGRGKEAGNAEGRWTNDIREHCEEVLGQGSTDQGEKPKKKHGTPAKRMKKKTRHWRKSATKGMPPDKGGT